MEPVKNKRVTYLLMCAVAAVWGIIVYRLFLAESADDEQSVFLQPKINHEAYDKYLPKTDTTRLVLNYRDPFPGKGSEVPEPVKAASEAIPVSRVFKPAPPQLNWSVIKYSGYFTNPNTKKIIAILVVNGKERMTQEGESLEGVKLLKNKRDSILVSWMGKQKYIKQ